jgi:bacterioferritin-associated ferredoxin
MNYPTIDQKIHAIELVRMLAEGKSDTSLTEISKLTGVGVTTCGRYFNEQLEVVQRERRHKGEMQVLNAEFNLLRTKSIEQIQVREEVINNRLCHVIPSIMNFI